MPFCELETPSTKQHGASTCCLIPIKEANGDSLRLSEDTILKVPPHPLGIKPAGNAYTAQDDLKSVAGCFSHLPDELVVQVLEFLDSTALVRLGATCKALYAFCRFDDLWKTLLVEYVYLSSALGVDKGQIFAVFGKFMKPSRRALLLTKENSFLV